MDVQVYLRQVNHTKKQEYIAGQKSLLKSSEVKEGSGKPTHSLTHPYPYLPTKRESVFVWIKRPPPPPHSHSSHFFLKNVFNTWINKITNCLAIYLAKIIEDVLIVYIELGF